MNQQLKGNLSQINSNRFNSFNSAKALFIFEED